MAAVLALFSRKNKVQSAACMISLDHEHVDACFIEVAPLSVVELFQSQGCKSCPPAIPGIHKAVGSSPNLLLLTYDRAYATNWGRKGLFTPQVVVDGVANEIVGAEESSLGQIMAVTMDAKNRMDWSVLAEVIGPSEVRITSHKPEAGPHDVLIVEYDPAMQQVKIGGGANKKVKLQHLNVVENLTKIGEWAGGQSTIQVPPPSNSAWKRALLVQGGPGGPIVAALNL